MADDKKIAAKFKVLIIGASGVGKSSILTAYVNQNFTSLNEPTIGVDFKTKEMNVHGEWIKLGIWDTAGMERFRGVIPSFYRGTHGVILVYDITRRETLTDLNHWLEELKHYSDKANIAGLVLGNKIDEMNKRAVTTEEGQQFAQKHRFLFLESSAKTRVNVDLAFEELAYKIYETNDLWDYEQPPETSSVPQDQSRCCGYV